MSKSGLIQKRCCSEMVSPRRQNFSFEQGQDVFQEKYRSVGLLLQKDASQKESHCTWFLPQSGCLMMLTLGLKQASPWYSLYSPSRRLWLYQARISYDVAFVHRKLYRPTERRNIKSFPNNGIKKKKTLVVDNFITKQVWSHNVTFQIKTFLYFFFVCFFRF